MSAKDLPGEEKTVDAKVADPEASPKAGVEREDAQPDEALAAVAQVAAGVRVMGTPKGRGSDGSGDTSGYGGLVSAGLEISHFLKSQRDVHTIAFVGAKAISAGAMIAIACDEIVMAPSAQIGDCAPAWK